MSAAPALRAREVRTYGPAVAVRDLEVSGARAQYLEGLAVPYGVEQDVGWMLETMAPGVFSRSISEAARGLPLLLWHDSRTYPVGVSETWAEDADGLRGVWRLDGGDEAQRAAQLAQDGLLVGLSVGFVPIRSTWTYADVWDPDRGPDGMDRVTREEARLLEVSLTPTPAYAGAQVSLVRSAGGELRRERERPGREVRAWRSWLDSIAR